MDFALPIADELSNAGHRRGPDGLPMDSGQSNGLAQFDMESARERRPLLPLVSVRQHHHVCRLLAGLVEDPAGTARPAPPPRPPPTPALAPLAPPGRAEPRRLVFVRSHGIWPGDLLDLLGHLAVLHNGDHANRHAPVHRREDVRDHADRPVSAPWSLAHLVTTLSSRSS